MHSLAFPEFSEFQKMNGMALRKAVEAAKSCQLDNSFWTSAGKRVIDISGSLKYWDAVCIAQAFAARKHSHNEDVFIALADSISQQISSMSPKHVLDSIAAFETACIRPKQLYVELYNALLKLTPAMYGEELAQTASSIARFKINNTHLLEKLKAAIVLNRGQLKFLHCCQIAGSFASLSCLDGGFLRTLEATARREVEGMRPEELFDSIKCLNSLNFSWEPFESNILRSNLLNFIDSVRGHEEIDQLSSPVEFLLFLKRRNILTPKVLLAFSKWLKEASLRLNTRMGRRPSSEELFLVADYCWEFQCGEADALEAIKNYSLEADGESKPLKYARKRVYVNAADALATAKVAPAAWPVARHPKVASYRLSLGKSPLKNGRPAWLNFNLAWYYNR